MQQQGIDYDPRSEEVLADPFPFYAQLRESCPIHFHEGTDPAFYSVTRYADVRQVLADVDVWSSAFGTTLMYLHRPVGVLSDPPDHSEFRKIFSPRFSPTAVASHHDQVRAIAGGLVERMLQGNAADLYEAYASRLPLMIICELLGLPHADVVYLREVTDSLVESGFGGGNPKRSQWLEAYMDLSRFFDEHVQRRRRAASEAGIEELDNSHVGSILPDDITSLFVAAKYQGRRLTDPEIHFALYGLLLGGSKATSGLISNLFMRLLEEPARWEAVKRDPGLFDVAIEESLRYDSPTLGMWRTSKCPVKMHDVEIPERSKLMVVYAAANRDPSVFDQPDDFRLDRSLAQLRKHVAFGYGPHFCAGAALSRLEAKITLELFTRHMPGLRLAGPHERLTTTFSFWGRKKLPVCWDA